MSELLIDVEIGGDKYSQAQLARIQYERALHVLHEFKYLGAKLYDGEKELSHQDINWLEPARAEQISLDFRTSVGEDGILDLFRDVIEDTDRRWKTFIEGYIDGEVRTGQTDITVSGVSMQETMAGLAGGDSDFALSIMPEHYIVIGGITAGQRGMETFGMFGEPSYVHGIASADVPDHFPFKKDPEYPMTLCGEMRLKSDDTPIHVGALHQLKPLDDGFTMRSIFFCPKAVPQAMADGHRLHFAIEICNGIKAAYAKKTGQAAR